MVRSESVVAIGEYDGFHLGHADLVRTARQLVRATGCAAVAVVVDAGNGMPKLLPVERRCALAVQSGADWAVVIGAARPGRDDLAARLAHLAYDELGARAAVLACAPADGPPVRRPALVDQIARDVRATRDVLARTDTLDTPYDPRNDEGGEHGGKP